MVLIKKSDIKRLKIGIYGGNNTLEIYESCMLRDTNIIIKGNNLRITIKNNCEIGGATIVCAGENSSIHIDEQCLIASNIEIRNNDGHSIFENGNLINPSSNIHIGNNVWICQNAKILKGAYVGSNSVIALNALVSSGVYENNVILAGIPAKIIKRDIFWSKELPN
ncbi:acyltransferase [Aliarcobacter cryaerophilus]|uniref:acyltransferase n=1 Tax=Aliarcobacter cryaerophilus TaxID=28198 RepID=UPI0021B5C769|nr:acyltransferase [Aliarcobacter cryaerophilus]MCT7462695.1 acyltransferase [Aliarcobacter cryaerophilus]